ncbi:MAG: hypothetical protein IT271_13350 [Chitinophagales bacterium]|nr:hypothetical protein [Chitinophagales bacterium]
MRYTSLLFSSLIIISCQKKLPYNYLEWHEKTKHQILIESNQIYNDSCHGLFDCEMFHEMHYFNEGKQYLVKEYKCGVLFTERHYDKSQKYELRTKLHKNGNLASDGLLYCGLYYGLYRSWYENGKLRELGIKYENNYIGKYKIWTRSGKCTEIDATNKTPVNMPDIFK